MESSIRQTRVRFHGVGDEDKDESRSIQPQKSPSFKGEKKKSQNWLRRQFLRETSQDFDSNNGVEYVAAAFDSNDGAEYAAAVAAAAYAIKLLEELSIAEQKSERADTSLIKSRTEDTSTRIPEAGRISRRFSDELSMTNLETPDKAAPVSVAKDEKIPEKAVRPSPSIKKTASFADKPLDTTVSRKPESALPKMELPSTKPPTFQPPDIRRPTDIRRQSLTRPGTEETEADAWEQTELARIEEKYDKLYTSISDWESKKKAKAKRERDKTEAELERRRAKAMKKYRTEMENIAKIAGGARAQAEENQRNEEFKVKEKADKIRSTGKTPPTCWCF